MTSTTQTVFIAVLVTLGVVAPISAYTGIGNQLKHTFLKFDALPMTTAEAQAAGWSAVSGCDSDVGTLYQNHVPTDYHPIQLYFTSGGQIAGFGLIVSGDQPPTLVPDFWVPYSDSAHSITITFRDGDMCTGETFADPLGDSVIVNKATSGFPVPITLSGAISAGWGKGGCIGGMGTHWSFDLAASPLLSYNVSTLVPVTAMYESDTQAIGAILIQTSAIQEHIPAVGDWEGPFPPSLLCYNYCDNAQCEPGITASTPGPFHLTNTMHFLFRDHHLNKCASHC